MPDFVRDASAGSSKFFPMAPAAAWSSFSTAQTFSPKKPRRLGDEPVFY